VFGDAAGSWLGAFDDEVRVTRPRRRALVAIGLGEFVDAYDLIVIGGLNFALESHFRMSSGEFAWLTAAAFFGSAVGALFFGNLADRIGRRRVFLLNLVAFVGLALLSAVVTEVWMLFVIRILIGVAIGADIAASISFLAELSPKGSRGGWTGAMPQIAWSLGAMCAVLIDAGLYASVGADAWRLAFAAGALPAVAVCLRDWIVARRFDAFLILSFYFGCWLAWALLPRTLGFLYYYLPSATVASLALVYALRRGNSPRWLLWAFVAIAFAGFAMMLPVSAAFVGTSMETFNRLMIFQSWI